ncbi:MAG TPA: hypothetical protein VJT73_17175 [Polyangiaceae bacterium]|nr:hypothetical protein [Polyangiaceae bacterium]
MEPQELVGALEAIAAQLGIPVRYEAMSRARAGGGLCRLRGQPVILVDSKQSPSERAAVLAEALATFDLDGIYLPPLVRAAIRAKGNTHVLEPRPLARARPKSDE